MLAIVTFKNFNSEKEKTVDLTFDNLSQLKGELERIHFQYVTLHDRISSVAGDINILRLV